MWLFAAKLSKFSMREPLKLTFKGQQTKVKRGRQKRGSGLEVGTSGEGKSERSKKE